MKRVLLVLAAALPLASCAGYYGGGYGGYYDGGPVAYDGFYDGYYGSFYDGYWGNDGFFYYRGGEHDHRFRRGDPSHFHRGGPGGPPGGNFHAMQGQFNRGPGMRTPHFGGPGGPGGGHGPGGGGFHGGGGRSGGGHH